MTWNNSIFPLLIVTGSGPGTGFFVYNGAPAKGSLIAAIVGPGTTTDPYGNAVSSVLNVGTWNAAGTLLQHFGINNSGDTFLVNNAGLTVQHARSSDGSMFFYNTSGEGAGNLIGSVAPAVTTDPPGNTVQSGITSYTSGKYAQLLAAILTFFQTGNTTNPNVSGAFGQLRLQSGSTPANTAASTVTLQPGATNANLEIDNSSVVLQGIATPGSPATGNTLLFSDTNGFERMLPGLSGDTNAYQIGEIIQVSAGFTISSTTPQTILSAPVGIGTYVVEVWFVTSNSTPADGAGFAFTGPAAGVQLVAFESKTTGTAVVGYGASATYTTTFNSQGIGGNQDILLRATIAFSAAGTLAITGKQLVAANNVTVFGGWMRLRHMS